MRMSRVLIMRIKLTKVSVGEVPLNQIILSSLLPASFTFSTDLFSFPGLLCYAEVPLPKSSSNGST